MYCSCVFMSVVCNCPGCTLGGAIIAKTLDRIWGPIHRRCHGRSVHNLYFELKSQATFLIHTYLSYWVAINNVQWVERLVEQGADVTRAIPPYEMPLVHYAANSGRVDCLKV